LAVDPTLTWESQKRGVRRKVIPAIIEKLLRYKANHSDIQQILKQHHKTQWRTIKINNNANLQDHNRRRMLRNTKINEVNIGIPIGLSLLLVNILHRYRNDCAAERHWHIYSKVVTSE